MLPCGRWNTLTSLPSGGIRDEHFYERMVPLADQLYDEYLKELRKEGLI